MTKKVNDRLHREIKSLEIRRDQAIGGQMKAFHHMVVVHDLLDLVMNTQDYHYSETRIEMIRSYIERYLAKNSIHVDGGVTDFEPPPDNMDDIPF